MTIIFTMEKKIKIIDKAREVIKQIPINKRNFNFSYEKKEIVDKKILKTLIKF